MDAHPISEIWPMMEGKDFEELALDVAAHGLRVPIVLYQGKILDGRNRERACLEAGVEPRYQEARATDDDEAIDLVFSLNQHRRHLSIEQRAFAAARLANLKQGGDRRSFKGSIDPLKTIDHAADKMKVSRGSVRRAKRIMTDGTEDDVKEVMTQKASLAKKALDVAARKRTQKTSVRSEIVTPRAMPSMRDRERFFRPSGTVKALTRHQVDPEFQGTDFEFTDKYGHVVMHTAEDRARIRFGDWASGMKLVAKAMAGYPNWSEVDHNWLRSPKKRDVEKLTEALAQIRGKVAEAEALLKRAREARGPQIRLV